MRHNRLGSAWRLQRQGMAVLWQGLTSPYALLAVTLVAFALAVLGGLWFHRQPGDSAGEIAATSRPGSLLARGGWLANLYASWGLLAIFDSWLGQVFMAVVALVALWQLLYVWFPSWARPPRRLARTCLLTLSCSPMEASRRLEWAFALGGRRLIPIRGTNTERIEPPANVSPSRALLAVAERGGLARWLSGFFYLGVLLLILAILVSRRWSWQSPRLDLALGETLPLEQEGSLALRLDRIEIFPAVGSDDLEMRSLFSLLRGARVEDEVALRQNNPREYQGLHIYQVGLGPAARVTASNPVGEAMAIQPLVGDTALQRSIRVRFSDQQQEHQLAVPDADIVLRMVHYPSLPQQGFRDSVLHAQLLRGTDGQLLQEQFLTENATISSGGVSVHIALEYFVSVQAQREPELPMLAVAGVCLAAGIFGLVLWPPRRAWVMVEECAQGSICQLVTARRDDQSPWFTCARSLLAETAHD